MTTILIVSDRDAGRVWTYPLNRDPFVTIEQVELPHADGDEWGEIGHKVTCSADGGTCVRWGLDDTDRPLSVLIGNAETHVENHVAGKS